MSNTIARVPYARLSPGTIGAVDRELQKIERQQAGMFVPRILVAGMNAVAYVVSATDWLILCDCTAGPITLTFPLAARVDGLFVTVVKTDASANAVTLSGTFSGSVNPTLTVQHATRIIQAGNGVYEMTPKLADLTSGTITGNVVITGTLASGALTVTADNQAATYKAATASAAIYQMIQTSTGTDRGYWGFPIASDATMFVVNKEAGDLIFGTSNASRCRVPALGGFVVGQAAIATNATDGFLYLPSCAGAPTGTPTAFTGRIPVVYDSSNNFLYIYNSGWKKSTVYA